jgi:hypothetical protein
MRLVLFAWQIACWVVCLVCVCVSPDATTTVCFGIATLALALTTILNFA